MLYWRLLLVLILVSLHLPCLLVSRPLALSGLPPFDTVILISPSPLFRSDQSFCWLLSLVFMLPILPLN